jgi:ABC-type antimicrobial peptide transport system permease subunit
MRRESRFVDGLFARTDVPRLHVGVQGTTDVGTGLHVTGDYYATLGVRPSAGRLLTADDDRPGHAAVAVISYAYWQRRFGGSAASVGATVTLKRVPFVVVGVEPPGFRGVTLGNAPDVIVPMQALPLLNTNTPPFDAAFSTWIQIMGRLRADASIAQVTEELTSIYRRVSLDAAGAAGPTSDTGKLARETRVVIQPGARGGVSGLRNTYERGLRLLLLMLGGVLCLASLNVAALLLARSESRAEEMATRLALGASRSRIVRQLLTESAVIAAGGALLGLALAWRGSELPAVRRAASAARDRLVAFVVDA